jgi:hypothetical protein
VSTAHSAPAPRRVIVVAAALAERYLNPDVAAFNRSRHAKWGNGRAPASTRREHFWFVVGRALGAAYGRRGCPTDYERAMRREIDAARAEIEMRRLVAENARLIAAERSYLTGTAA